MEFKNGELVEREIEIGNFLMQGFSLKIITEKTGLGKKIIAAHIHNMMKKLKAEDITTLINLLKNIEL